MDLAPLLRRHPAVQAVSLVGSRAGGEQTELSDWDFAVETDDFDTVAATLPELVEPLEPLARQWDPLAECPTYMLMLSGPTKVDLIFVHETMEEEPPWAARPDTLAAIDAHFWDWILWLAAKHRRGKEELVATELVKMHGYLLGPMGIEAAPSSIEEALDAYLAARGRLEQRFGVAVPRALEREVAPVLRS